MSIDTVHAKITDLDVLTQIASALNTQGKTLYIASDGTATIQSMVTRLGDEPSPDFCGAGPSWGALWGTLP